ncbi:DNA-binding protein [Lachnospiraceae bacterium 48-33]
MRILCAEGKVSGVTREGRSWMIPADARKPEDGRFKVTESLLTVIEREYAGCMLMGFLKIVRMAL